MIVIYIYGYDYAAFNYEQLNKEEESKVIEDAFKAYPEPIHFEREDQYQNMLCFDAILHKFDKVDSNFIDFTKSQLLDEDIMKDRNFYIVDEEICYK